MYIVYRIQSKNFPEHIYIGYTQNLEKRILAHNYGQSLYTSKYKPWKIINYFVFKDKEKAVKFEKYLKSGSGRAFAKRHF